jgi:beta-glucosidase
VADVLRLKLQLGLFEHPYADGPGASAPPAEHLQHARQLARQSIVLLKNQDGLLPLDRSRIKRLAVIGPLADAKRAQLGTWIPDGRESESRTLLAALRESTGSGLELLFAPGLADDLDRSTVQFDEAVNVARRADVVLLAVGERAELSGEARSRSVLDLPGAQNELIDAIGATGKPIVLVVQAGRPLTIGRQIEKVRSVLYSFHAGTMAGPAIADLLWGIETPSGKLPVTFPKSVGQVPLYYNHTNTGRPPLAYEPARDSKVDDAINLNLGYTSNYIDIGPYPLFPFGYGLSYTTFQYGEIELSAARLRSGDVLAVRVPVTNTGERAGEEVVQLYIRDPAASVVRPVRELKDFRRIPCEPGETVVVEFALPTAKLAYYDAHGKPIEALGKIEIYVGGSSLADRAVQFEIVKQTATGEQ